MEIIITLCLFVPYLTFRLYKMKKTKSMFQKHNVELVRIIYSLVSAILVWFGAITTLAEAVLLVAVLIDMIIEENKKR